MYIRKRKRSKKGINCIFRYTRSPQSFYSYEPENKTGLYSSQHHPTVHALLSWHVQILQMETCTCLINYQECTLRVALQNLSAEKYAIKKPQGMWAVCSPCSTGVPMLRFQGKSQTICADLFELESWCGGRGISKGKGCRKKGWRKNCLSGETVFELQSSIDPASPNFPPRRNDFYKINVAKSCACFILCVEFTHLAYFLMNELVFHEHLLNVGSDDM